MSKIKTPSVSANAGGGLPGSSSRARMNEAAGQKVTGIRPGKSDAYAAPDNVRVSSGSDMVMPTDHPAAKTTRTTKGGTL